MIDVKWNESYESWFSKVLHMRDQIEIGFGGLREVHGETLPPASSDGQIIFDLFCQASTHWCKSEVPERAGR